MKKILTLSACLASLTFLAGCSLVNYAATTSGAIQPRGAVTDCGAFTFTSFKERLRVSPREFGANSLLAYMDFGPGMPRGAVYYVVPTSGFQSRDFSKELYMMDPRHLSMWHEAIHLGGNYQGDGIFWGYVPEKSRTIGNGKMIDRPEILFVGRTERNGAEKYFLLQLDEDIGHRGRPKQFEDMKKSFHAFQSAVEFKKASKS